MIVLLPSYYGWRESIQSAVDCLVQLGLSMFDFPLRKKIDQLGLTGCWESLLQYIKEIQPNVILWWWIPFSVDQLAYLNREFPQIKQILYNWDDPYDWNLNDYPRKAQYLDQAFLSCRSSISRYQGAGTRRAHFLPPGYDPEINYPIIFDPPQYTQYVCDISCCLTNLYENDQLYPDQVISRKWILDTIYQGHKEKKYTFYLYGPPFLKKMYPLSYRKPVSYNELNLVFNYSKINLSTHVVGNQSGYLNERTVLILGSGGLLLIDPIKDLETLLEEGQECLVLQPDRLIDQIVEILDQYNRTDSLETPWMIRYRGHQKSLQWTWSKWAEKIYRSLI